MEQFIRSLFIGYLLIIYRNNVYLEECLCQVWRDFEKYFNSYHVDKDFLE